MHFLGKRKQAMCLSSISNNKKLNYYSNKWLSMV